jgi:hypothetical protein
MYSEEIQMAAKGTHASDTMRMARCTISPTLRYLPAYHTPG